MWSGANSFPSPADAGTGTGISVAQRKLGPALSSQNADFVICFFTLDQQAFKAFAGTAISAALASYWLSAV